MIKVILFDFYGVFLPDAYGAWLKANGLKREGIFSELINQLDRSDISESDFFEQLSRALGREVQKNEIHQETRLPDTRLIETIRRLKPRYTIALFSNASTKLRNKLDSLELTPLLDTIIISSEIGYAKPSDEAFEAALKILDVRPEEILFIDDNPKNVEAAEKHAMKACHYTSLDSLDEVMQILIQ
jgi:HAD superfamily hydrolase (TIGR01509 family)